MTRYNVEVKKNQVFLKNGTHIIDRLHHHRIVFTGIDIKNDLINFTGTFTSCCSSENILIQAIKKSKDKHKEIYLANYLDYGDISIKKHLSKNWEYIYSFDIKIPIKVEEEAKIFFRVVYNDSCEEVVMNNRIFFYHRCQLSNFNPYLIKNGRIIKVKGKTFYTFPYSFYSFFKNELGTIKNIYFLMKNFQSVLFYLDLFI